MSSPEPAQSSPEQTRPSPESARSSPERVRAAVEACAAAHAAAGRGDAQPIWIQLLSTVEVASWAERATGEGALAGLPFAIKDNLDLAGCHTTAGCPDLATGPVATESATAVHRLVEAGAVPIGKTNLDQFATGLVGSRSPYGTCHSVASPRHVSGGSSSGSAIAVATGLVPLALGTDTAGSGRVPAAFNGIVGVKPTRGLVSNRGVLPACRSLDCITTFTRTVSEARAALDALIWPDPADPWSRATPSAPPPGVATRMRVVAVPEAPLDLDPEHEKAWQRALAQAHRIAAHVVTVDIGPFLAAASLLYQGPWLAARWAAVGHLLHGEHVDPTVRAVITAGREVTGADVFTGMDRLAGLRRATEDVWSTVDALLLPVTPGHPTLSEVAADPTGVNTRLGTYTNFVNLLDLCAVAVPAGSRDDGLPFGVQLIAPAFADAGLLNLAARWCDEPERLAPVPSASTLLAVCGAHLSGLALNPQLVALSGRLRYRARTAAGYRLYRLPGDGVARPGLVRVQSGGTLPGGAGAGIEVEVWELPHHGVGALLDSVPAPLGFGHVELDDGSVVAGFLAEEHGVRDATDITAYGGWRQYIAQRPPKRIPW